MPSLYLRTPFLFPSPLSSSPLPLLLLVQSFICTNANSLSWRPYPSCPDRRCLFPFLVLRLGVHHACVCVFCVCCVCVVCVCGWVCLTLFCCLWCRCRLVLVGTKVDLRDAVVASQQSSDSFVSTEQGRQVSLEVNAARYYEVSALTQKVARSYLCVCRMLPFVSTQCSMCVSLLLLPLSLSLSLARSLLLPPLLLPPLCCVSVCAQGLKEMFIDAVHIVWKKRREKTEKNSSRCSIL